MDELLPKKYLILLEIATGNYHSLAQIAEKIGITKQGVYEHLKKMKKDGFIDVICDTYVATANGIDILFIYLDALETYLLEKKKSLSIIKLSSAIAADTIQKGDRVWLAMEKGYLRAYTSKKTPASAEAAETAQQGEDVAVTNITGVIDLIPGTIHIFVLPSVAQGGSKKVSIEVVKSYIESITVDKIGVLDLVGKITLEKIGAHQDFEFRPVETALELAQKGCDILLIGEQKTVHNAVASIEQYNQTAFDEIHYQCYNNTNGQ